ncbi:arsenosugar biosynthesis radical SAM (seleno)protein ArsS [Synechococcus sp. CS-205]|uniref:arsenosugar biosynthesis radical SAM (seleno)protein ArsS n=1 Tax=Synechococcus sp. CS-205 TaxID=2847984 RepID=UPI0021B04E3C|nr:arsenosugar biosynthesis radical SAM (seleno)protein ArsS [Synechococcus sp. CS-205]MCT0248734.1 arsenosugar biosynthesis radical SAM protein ArsS [Synechococcus sp. CS-205]
MTTAPSLTTSGHDRLEPRQAFPPLRRGRLDTLQVNLTYRCNQACVHCHVNAGPTRTESMETATLALIPRVLAARGLRCLDLTGGAPELHPQFRQLVRQARALGVEVIDRCNLTILQEPGQEDLAGFLAGQGVTVVASLPCYLQDNVERQRGSGVFQRSISGLRQLNALGYGRPGSGLELNLVFNPQGAVLPPEQGPLEADYRRVLQADHGVVFNRLYALANMPVQRFAAVLSAQGELEGYRELLRRSHCDDNLSQVMCRQLISVDWQGFLYDCDFNQQLGLAAAGDPAADAESGCGERSHLRDLLQRDPAGDPIQVAEHCFGCTAGSGSSCGGALAA